MKFLKATGKLLILSIFVLLLVNSTDSYIANVANADEINSIPIYGYKIINSYPHSTESFTQGLVFDNGTLYESTGLNGRSGIQIVDLETGKIIKSKAIADKYFGEGITIVEDKIIQLTWRAQKGFVYNKNTFDLLKTFSYDSQGWGITYNGKYLIMSDGSNILYFMDPRTFKVRGKLEVYDGDRKLDKLNELEYIDGKIYANVWGTEKLAIINPKTGQVTAWIDLRGLLSKEDKQNRIDVLNGIAYNEENQKLYVTGKLWPKLFEIEIVKGKNH